MTPSKVSAPVGTAGSATGCAGGDDDGAHLQQVADAPGRAGGGGEFAPHLGELAERGRAEHGVEQELRELAARHAVRQHVVRAVPQDADDAGEDEQDHHAGEDRACGDGRARGLERLLDRRLEARRRLPLGVVGLHGTHRAEALGGVGGGVGQRVLRRARALAHGAARGDEREDDGGDDDEHEGRQLGGRDEHQRQRAGEEEQVAQQHGGRGAEGRFQLRRVGGEAADQLADARLVVERRVERGEMGEDVGTQVRDDALAQRLHEEVARGAGHREHQHDRQHGDEVGVDDADLVGLEAEVDDAADRDGHDQRRRRGQRERGQGAGDAALVAQRVGQHRRQGLEVDLAAAAPALGSGDRGLGGGDRLLDERDVCHGQFIGLPARRRTSKDAAAIFARHGRAMVA